LDRAVVGMSAAPKSSDADQGPASSLILISFFASRSSAFSPAAAMSVMMVAYEEIHEGREDRRGSSTCQALESGRLADPRRA
jgi:hypothetical protein